MPADKDFKRLVRARMQKTDDWTSVVVGFTRRGAAKSQVQVQHGKLPDRAAVTRVKQYWADRLGALEDVLAPDQTHDRDRQAPGGRGGT